VRTVPITAPESPTFDERWQLPVMLARTEQPVAEFGLTALARSRLAIPVICWREITVLDRA
jgi:hypothetical protein